MDLSNPHQVRILCSCYDMGVKVVKNFIQPARVKSKVRAAPQIETEVSELVYRTRDAEHPSKAVSFDSDSCKDLMHIEVVFGNQNIKADRISKQESTLDFVDQELNFHFRPITCLYQTELINKITKFFQMDIDLNAETKLKAQDECEKLREALSLQNVFEAQNQIQSNLKMKI
jgi:hypothetical protein